MPRKNPNQRERGQGRPLRAAALATMKPGRHSDGRYGLMLNVKPSGARSWMQRLTVNGERRTIGLGPFPVVSLAEARAMAFENIRKRQQGINPIVERKRASTVPTFAEAADSYIRLQAATWKAGSRNEANWRSSLVHAKAIADSPVDSVMTDDVAAIVMSLLSAGKAPTAKAVRQRIRLVFDWVIAQGHRQDNPANGAIDAILPKANHRVTHHEAVPVADVPNVIGRIRAIDDPKWRGMVGAMELCILTATRTSEVLGMVFDEVNWQERTWTVPAGRMKAGKPHRVPLSAAAMEVLQTARTRHGGTGLVFRSPTGRRIDEGGLRRVMKRAGIPATVHGFRSTFRDWCSDVASPRVPRDVAEWSLAHVFMSDTEASYARSDLLERRRPVMERWSRHVTTTPAPKVVRLRG